MIDSEQLCYEPDLLTLDYHSVVGIVHHLFFLDVPVVWSFAAAKGSVVVDVLHPVASLVASVCSVATSVLPYGLRVNDPVVICLDFWIWIANASRLLFMSMVRSVFFLVKGF